MQIPNSHTQWFQITESPNKAVLTLVDIKSALIFVCLVLQQEQNLFLNRHAEYLEFINQTLRICIQVQFSQRYGQIKDRRPNFF